MPAQHIYKPNPAKAGFLLAEKAGMVWKCAGQAFNKLLVLPPFIQTQDTLKGGDNDVQHHHAVVGVLCAENLA